MDTKLKACFDCGADTILTDVIHHSYLRFMRREDCRLEYVLDKEVEYTCRMCGAKWYVNVGRITKTFKVSNIPVYFQLVVWGLYKFTSYRLLDENKQEVPWSIITPDYLDDLLKLSHNYAYVAYQSKEDK